MSADFSQKQPDWQTYARINEIFIRERQNQMRNDFLRKYLDNPIYSRLLQTIQNNDASSGNRFLNLYKLSKELKNSNAAREMAKLGGKDCPKIIKAWQDDEYDGVEKQLKDIKASIYTRANAYTALARHLESKNKKLAVLYARKAWEEDPRPFRLKWLIFRLSDAKQYLEAEALLDLLPEDISFSPSERKKITEIHRQVHKIASDEATEIAREIQNPLKNEINKSRKETTDLNLTLKKLVEEKRKLEIKIKENETNQKKLEEDKNYLQEKLARYNIGGASPNINVKTFIVDQTKNQILYSFDSGPFVCRNNGLLYDLGEKKIYFKSRDIKSLKKSTSYNLEIDCSLFGANPSFQVWDIDSKGEWQSSAVELKDGKNRLDFSTGPDHSILRLVLCVNKNGALKINSVNIVREKKQKYSLAYPLPTKSVASIRYATILSPHMEALLADEAQAIPLQTRDYLQTLRFGNVDFLLVESAPGKTFGSLSEKNNGQDKLDPVLDECKRLGIPSIFWFNNDASSFNDYVNVARMFDLILTADPQLIPRFQKASNREVYWLPFAAQPGLHHPPLLESRHDKAFYAGSWLGDKTPESEIFAKINSLLNKHALPYDIYECYEHVQPIAWPQAYKDKLKRKIASGEIPSLGRNHKFRILVNPVKSSPLPSRDFFESLAMGTPVICNSNPLIEHLFPCLFIKPEDGNLLAELLADKDYYNDFQEKGVMAIMNGHTWADRLREICRIIGLDTRPALRPATMVFHAENYDQALNAEVQFEKQTYRAKNLLVLLEPFDFYYDFFNKNTENKTFILARDEFALTPKTSAMRIKCENGKNYPQSWLEMNVYKTPGKYDE